MKPANPEKKISFHIYYKNKKPSQFLLPNASDQKKMTPESYTANNSPAKEQTVQSWSPLISAGRPPSYPYGRHSTQHFYHRVTTCLKHTTKSQKETYIVHKKYKKSMDTCVDARGLIILESSCIKERSPTLTLQTDIQRTLPNVHRGWGNTSPHTVADRGQAETSGECSLAQPTANQVQARRELTTRG